ncbi:MAG: hypothetical protein GXO67_06615 [Archaeoglobi archaeon]|nr:hypothetical protein [Archaeoglobi archaeon]
MRVRIRTPSRIHITLIDLNGKIGRVDGGVGLTLDSPGIELVARESDGVVVKGEGESLKRFEDVAKIFAEKFGRGIEVEVKESYSSHIGLGSGTQTSLAVGVAYCRLYGIDVSPRDVAVLTGRGGTSGVGVAAFESGGLIVDGGHSRREKPGFLPSSFSRARPAPVISRLDFPEDWDVYLFIPEGKGFYGMREKDLFERNTPLPLEEVRELSHLILMKLLPSVVEHDLDGFAEAVYRIQHLGFKRAEVMQYGDLISGAIEELREYGAVGMSSTGPTVYFIGEKEGVEAGKAYFSERGVDVGVVKTKARNRGADIEV